MLGNTSFFEGYRYEEGEVILAVSIDNVEYYVIFVARKTREYPADKWLLVIGLPVLHPAFDSPSSVIGGYVENMHQSFRELSPNEINPPFGIRGRRWVGQRFISASLSSMEVIIENEVMHFRSVLGERK